MNLLQQFIQYCKQELRLVPHQTQLVLAVSGGVDSVVLVDLCHHAGFDFVIAHCNFQLRGEESMRDENFLRSLGEKYNKQVLIKQFDTKVYAEANKCSIQVAARELRYGWFEEVMRDKHKQQSLDSKDLQLITYNSSSPPPTTQMTI